MPDFQEWRYTLRERRGMQPSFSANSKTLQLKLKPGSCVPQNNALPLVYANGRACRYNTGCRIWLLDFDR
jgi:hypothetical protein